MTHFEKELQSLTVSKYANMMFYSRSYTCENCPVYKQCKGFTCGYDCTQKIIKYLESEVEVNEESTES